MKKDKTDDPFLRHDWLPRKRQTKNIGRTMIYSVEAFDKEDESLAFEIALPEGCETQLAKIMNWTSPQRGDEGYNLNDAQLSNIEALTNKCFKNEKYIFQLTCNVI